MSGVNVQAAPFGGRYEILAPLATGGMADLFLARAVGIKGFAKTVVIKRVRRDRDALSDMLLDEARIAAQLVHPNIVQVHDLGAEQGGYFLAMEYVPGPDLRALAREAGRRDVPIPLELALHIILEVSAGLHHAHELAAPDGTPLHIVHRDVSPANILISRDGAVKITDFGIAKFNATREVETATGTVKGKFSYMSPEQASGLEIDRRSDVFSLGVVLWEITTGRRLFTGKNDLQVLQRVIHHPITRPSEIDPAYPPALEAIVMRALDRDPNTRFQTVEQLLWDVEDFTETMRLAGSPRRLGRFVTRLFPADQMVPEAPAQIAVGTHTDPGSRPSSAAAVPMIEEAPTQISESGASRPGVPPPAAPVPEYPRAVMPQQPHAHPPTPSTGTMEVGGADPPRSRAILIGFVLTLAVGSIAFALAGGFGGGSDGDEPAAAEEAPPAATEGAPAVQPLPEPEPDKAEPEPAPEPEEELVIDEAEAAAETGAGTETGTETETAAARAKKTHRPKKRPKKKKKKKKKTWTEDSPLLPSSGEDSALLPSSQ